MSKTIPACDLIAAGRRDFYGPVHEGLRLRHAQMLQRLGKADFREDASALFADLRAHLHMAVVHLVDEEAHIHHRLEARLPGASHALADQHANHRRHIVRLHDEIRRIESDPACNARSGHLLYLAFSRFVADDLAHMAFEEETTWPVLCSVFTDDELGAIEDEIVAGLAPDMAAAFTAAMPAPEYACFFDAVVRPALDAGQFDAMAAHGLLP